MRKAVFLLAHGHEEVEPGPIERGPAGDGKRHAAAAAKIVLGGLLQQQAQPGGRVGLALTAGLRAGVDKDVDVGHELRVDGVTAAQAVDGVARGAVLPLYEGVQRRRLVPALVLKGGNVDGGVVHFAFEVRDLHGGTVVRAGSGCR